MMDISEPNQPRHPFPLFSLGFRPFFLGAAVFTVLSVFLWVLVYTFQKDYVFYPGTASLWHAHEMIYGYCMAVVAGFLLTAAGNWTKRIILQNWALFAVFAFWCMGRILPLAWKSVPVEVYAAVDCLFIFCVALSVGVAIIRAKQWHNLGIVLLTFTMYFGNVLFYLGLSGYLDNGIQQGLTIGFYAVLTLLLLMGRRVIPFFIEKGVRQIGAKSIQLKNPVWLDLSCIWGFVLFAVLDVVQIGDGLLGMIAAIVFVFHSIRLVYWHHPEIWSRPLLWVLYLGYAWVLVGLMLKILVVFSVSPYFSLHAFAFGAVGMVTIGMMSRISLAHTGRSILEPPAELGWLFLFLFIGAVIRVLFPLVIPAYHELWVGISAWFWIFAFLGFSWVYFPILVSQDAN